MAPAHFSIGIDLGTTNSALAYVPLLADATPEILMIPQWENMDAHTAFKASDVYLPFVQLFAPFSKGGALEHFEMD